MACTDPISCATEAVGNLATNALSDAVAGPLGAIVGSLMAFVTDVLGVVSTLWFSVPSPDVAGDDHLPTGVVETLQSGLAWPVMVLLLITFMVAVAKMAYTAQGAYIKDIIRLLVTVMASTGLIVGVVGLLVAAGDQFAPWIVQRATGEEFSGEALKGLIVTTGVNYQQAAAGWLILGIVALIASLMQAVFMVLRGACLIVFLAILPLMAASSGTEAGQRRFQKVLGWLLAFTLYKPAAGLIYAAGLYLLKQPTPASDDLGLAIMGTIYGLVIIALGVLALPALIKLFTPDAAAGSSNAFSGAAGVAAIAALVAGGAALAGGLAGAGAAGGGAAGGAAGGSGSAPLGPAARSAAPQGAASGGGLNGWAAHSTRPPTAPAPTSPESGSLGGGSSTRNNTAPRRAADGSPVRGDASDGGKAPGASGAPGGTSASRRAADHFPSSNGTQRGRRAADKLADGLGLNDNPPDDTPSGAENRR